MNAPASEDRELLDLLAEYFADQLTEENKARLQDRLRREDDARQLFRRYVLVVAGIHWELADSQHTEPEMVSAAAESHQSVPLLQSVPVSSPPISTAAGVFARSAASFSRPVVLSVGVVSLLFCCYVGILFWNLRSGKLPEGTSISEPVAMLVDSQDAAWQNSGTETESAKSGIAAGQPLAITSGLVELQLKQGTTLLIEGPAKWKINGNNSATLTHGKLVAKVPKQAIGFTLETPDARIVDLGTEFGVEVAGDGASDVYVLKGQVDVQTPDVASDRGSRKLQAGQSARISTAGTKVESPSALPEQFKRLVDATLKRSDAAPPADGKPVVVRFQNGRINPLIGESYRGCSDTQLISWAPNDNWGKRLNFDVGSFQGPANTVLRFDLTSLAGKFSKITSARLVLNQDQGLQVKGPGSVEVHLLAVANRDWVEGVRKSYTEIPRNEGATWNQRATGVRWAGTNGASEAGVDFDPRVLARQEYTATFSNKPFVFELEGDLSFLADWANDDKSNSGFLLRNGSQNVQNNRIAFYSSEFPDMAARPSLEIEYEPLTVNPQP